MSQFEQGIRFSVGETLEQRKLQQMVDNQQYLYNNRIRVEYRGYGLTRTEGLRIAAGIEPLPVFTRGSSFPRDVYFGNFFSVGCRPVVTTALATSDWRIFVTIKTLGNQGIDTGHNGFRAQISHQAYPGKSYNHPRQQFLHWIAVGY